MPNESPPSIYIFSGGVGASGEQLVNTVLAQFPDNQIELIVKSNLRQPEQIEKALAEVQETGGLVVHTMVSTTLQQQLIQRAQEKNIPAIDLMGDLVAYLSKTLGEEPAGKPGLYRQLHKDYFERVAAIDFALAHDDGKNPEGWEQADVLLVGVSRVGKTPTSMYLSVLGWKAANYPFVAGIAVPEELFQIDNRRVVGLTIDPAHLITHREQRQRRLGTTGKSAYTDPAAVYEELETAANLFKQGNFSTIDVTAKPIETTADEIIQLLTRRFGD
jgi:regulator of PEP synthase PpsR (kinase-PPPase family)